MRWGSGEQRGGQSGQATVEWVGLVLGVALVLGAVAAGGREAATRESAHELGDAVAKRITCAARDGCKAGGELRAAPGGRGGALGSVPGGLRAVTRPRSSPRRRSSPRPPRQPSKLGESLPARGAKGVLKRGWMLCLGYRRWQYDVKHPRLPGQPMPVREAAKMLNECVNPLSFLFG
jgi:hypothetical protein